MTLVPRITVAILLMHSRMAIVMPYVENTPRMQGVDDDKAIS